MKLNKLLSSICGPFCSGLSILLFALLLIPKTGVAQAITARKTHILVLIDRSGSVHFDASKVSKLIAPQINSMHVAGDALGVAYIHSQTNANAEQLSVEAALPTDYATRGGATQQNMMMEFDEQLQEELSRMNTKLRKMLAQAADVNVRQSSDIWGSLATVDTFFRNASVNDNCMVFIISDMVESMSGKERRDFHVKHPQNDATTLKQMAATDVPKIRSIYGLNGKMPLAKVDRLTVLFPASGVQQSQNNAMTQYWTTVFELLGLPRQRLLFQ